MTYSEVVLAQAWPLQPPYFRTFQALVTEYARRPEQQLALFWEDYQHFHCSQCGDCCRGWDIPVDKAYYTHWTAYWAARKSPFQAPFRRLEQGASEQEYAVIRKKPDGSCLFLQADQRCFLHQHFGFKAKPLGCQKYPHYIQGNPNAYRVLLLAQSCRSTPPLMLDYPQLKGVWVKEDAEGIQVLRTAFRQTHLPLESAYLWLGWGLDILTDTQYSPLQNLARLKIFLSQLASLNLAEVTPETMTSLYQNWVMRPPALKKMHPIFKQKALQQFARILPRAFPQMDTWYQGFFSVPQPQAPALSPEEQTLWQRFIRQYLRQKWVQHAYEHNAFGELSLFQHATILAIFAFSVQVLSLYLLQKQSQSTLSLQILSRACNWLERILGHNQEWYQVLGIHQASPQELLILFQAFSAWDLTPPIRL